MQKKNLTTPLEICPQELLLGCKCTKKTRGRKAKEKENSDTCRQVEGKRCVAYSSACLLKAAVYWRRMDTVCSNGAGKNTQDRNQFGVACLWRTLGTWSGCSSVPWRRLGWSWACAPNISAFRLLEYRDRMRIDSTRRKRVAILILS